MIFVTFDWKIGSGLWNFGLGSLSEASVPNLNLSCFAFLQLLDFGRFSFGLGEKLETFLQFTTAK